MAIRKRRTGKASPRSVSTYSISRRSKGTTFPYVELLTKAQSSKQLQDPFANSRYQSLRGVIEPVYSPSTLAQLTLENNALIQCIESYVVNIESHGHVLEYIGPEGQEDSEEVQAEKAKINSFLASPSCEFTLREIRERARWDKESTGGAYFEISRNKKGEIIFIEHISAITMRMTKRDDEPTSTKVTIPDPDPDNDQDSFITKKIDRYFRRYVQIGNNGKRIYFKEFGDPRKINPETGEVDNSLSVEDEATEVYYWYQYTPGNVYGTPRWIGQLPSILGSRESEIVNLNFFRENAIPALAVLVSGGALTADTYDRITDYINAVRGRESMHRVMVLEAAADEAAGSVDHSQPAPKIEMKPMISDRQQEGLFQDYDQMNIQKIRSSFRLPPIYVGRAEDYTRASAFASMLVAESQIFLPERSLFDDLMNNRILSTYKVKFWKFKSVGPSTAEPEATARMIDSFSKEGALTPNAVIKIANQMLGITIDPILQPWGDFPFAVVMDMARSGREVIGFEDFMEKLDEGAGSPPVDGEPTDNENEDEDNVTPLPVAAANTVRRELSAIKKDMAEAVKEGFDSLQTSARE